MKPGDFENGFITGLFFGAIIGVVFVVFLARHAMGEFRADAIKRNYAQHNPVTGVWEWKEKTKDAK